MWLILLRHLFRRAANSRANRKQRERQKEHGEAIKRP